MLGGIGLPELIVIFLVILLLFGAKALPEIAKGLAQALKTFKKEAKEIKGDLDVESTSSPSTTMKSSETKKDTSQNFDPNDKGRDGGPQSDNNSTSEKG